jgi:hypothetical protein
MVWRFLGKGILLFAMVWLVSATPVCAQTVEDIAFSQNEEPAVPQKRISRHAAQMIAVAYIVFASGSLVFLFVFAFKMRRKHKKRLQQYVDALNLKRAAIHNEEPVRLEPAKVLAQSQPLLDPAIARLAFLKDLQTQGLISESDYERQKYRILERF